MFTNYYVDTIGLLQAEALLYQLSKHITIVRLKCEVGCKKIQSNPLSGKNLMTFRTTYNI